MGPSKSPEKENTAVQYACEVGHDKEMAPQVGFEPTTLRLTAGCSAIELLRSVVGGR
jgi:hypothetical protein